MADTKISALSAGTAAPGDEIPVNRGGSNFKITAGDILKINGGTITADSPVLNLTQTWNNAAVTFTGLKFNATDTTSASGSLLMDLQVGGTSQFKVGKTGNITTTGFVRAGMGTKAIPAISITDNGDTGFYSPSPGILSYGGNSRGEQFRFAPNGNFTLAYSGLISWVSASVDQSSIDLTIIRDAANTLAQRRSTNGQTFRVYGTTDSTGAGDPINYERFFVTAPSTVGGAVQLGTQKGGTGTARALELQTDGTTRLTIASTGQATFSDSQVNLNGSSLYHVRAIPTYSRIAMRGGSIDGFWAGNDGLGQSALCAIGFIGFSTSITGSADIKFFRDAANTVAQRNGANAQESRVYGSYTSATNYQRTSVKTVRESSGALSGASYTTTIAIPAYANLIGVTTRVTTDITGATTYDVGDGSDVDLWGAAIGITAGTASRTADFTAVGAVGAAATSRTITLTANGSNFTGGEVEICAHYLFTEAD